MAPIFVAAFLLLWLVLAIFPGPVLIAALMSVVLITCIWLLSLWWTTRAAGALRVTRRYTRRAFAGETVDVSLVVENGSRLPLGWVGLVETVPPTLRHASLAPILIGLGSRGHRTVSYRLHCRRRGSYALGPLDMSTGDLFGFCSTTRESIEPEGLLVYPRVVPLEQLGLPAASPLAELSAVSSLFEDHYRPVGVREYEPRDSLRHIHWKATLRMGEVLVKQYGRAESRETLICLDLRLAAYNLEWRSTVIEGAITVAASVAYHICIEERLSVGLATHARGARDSRVRLVRLATGAGEDHLAALLEALALAEPGNAMRFAQLVREEGARLTHGSTLVAVCATLDGDVAESLVELRQSGYAVALILVDVGAPRASVQLDSIPVRHIVVDRRLNPV